MPSKRIIILETPQTTRVHYALRADAPEGQGTPRPDYVSCYGDAADPDLQAIKDGTVHETLEVNAYVRQDGETGAQFRDRVQAALESRWSLWNGQVQAATPKSFYGRFWNGTAWSNFP